MSALRSAGVFVLLAIACACSGSSGTDAAPHQLCSQIDPSCSPAFAPTYDAIFDNVLAPRCALPGGGCHASDATRTTLILSDRDDAYRYLTGAADGRARVIPGSADYSLLMLRLESPGRTFQMPPGDPLAPG